MKPNEIISDFRKKYKKVGALKEVTKRGKFKVFTIEVTTFYYVLLTNKHNKVEKLKKVKKRDIKKAITFIKKDIKIILDDDLFNKVIEEENIKNEVTSNYIDFNKTPKTNYLKDFKNNKELKDYSFMLIVSSFLLDYLVAESILDKDTQKLLRKIDVHESLIYETQQYMIRYLRNSDKDLKKLKEYSDKKILDKVFKKYNFDIKHYPIMLGLYLLETWRYDVTNKTIPIHFNYKKLDKMIKVLEKDLSEDEFDFYRENSQKLAYEIFEKLYNDRPMTKNERKEFFNKLKGLKNGNK